MLNVSAFALGVTLLLATFESRAQQYIVTNLGTLGGTNSGVGPFSAATAINAMGDVAGYSISAETGNQVHAFITKPKTHYMVDLGALTRGGISQGYGINDRGQITGYAASADFDNPIHAFVTSADASAMSDLGTLACGTENYCNGSSYGTAINLSGQVTGYSSIATSIDTYHAFITSVTTGVMTDLGTLGGFESEAYGINTAGQVTGWAATTVGYAHAFITNASTDAMTDLGTLGGTGSEGFSINDRGEVTGVAVTASGVSHAFLYRNGRMRDLGTLGGATSQGNSVNDRGEVTGESLTSSGVTHAFLYRSGAMLDLNSEIGSAAAVYTLTSGQGINDRGQIAVKGILNATGEELALLLTPDDGRAELATVNGSAAATDIAATGHQPN